MINSLKALKDLLNKLTDEELEDGQIFINKTIVEDGEENDTFSLAEHCYIDENRDLKIIIELD